MRKGILLLIVRFFLPFSLISTFNQKVPSLVCYCFFFFGGCWGPGTQLLYCSFQTKKKDEGVQRTNKINYIYSEFQSLFIT
jgi:hypothetical protein